MFFKLQSTLFFLAIYTVYGPAKFWTLNDFALIKVTEADIATTLKTFKITFNV